MMNKAQSRRTFIYVLLDLLAATAAMAAAFWVRFVVFRGHDPVGGFGYHMLWGALFSPVYVVLYGLLGVYTLHPQRSFIHDYRNMVLGNTFGVMLYIDVIFVFRVVDFSRWMILIFYLILNTLSCVRGFAAHRILRSRYKNGAELKKLVLIGDGAAALDCARRLADRPETGFALIGSIGRSALPGLPLLGGMEELTAALERSGADQAVIALDEEDADTLGEILTSCESTGVKLTLLPVSYEYMASAPFFEPLAGLPLINVRRVALDDAGAEILKRAEDVIGALLLIVLTSPVMLMAAVGTRLSSPGPVIFRQVRIGRDRKPFSMLKFRSMEVNPGSDSAWTRPGDPRRTRFGAFMRRYSIDELPQLFNVLMGDMSLVGPRPEIPLYVEHFKYSIPLYMVRHRVRPGITGWAQVNGLRGDTSIPARVDYDLYYIENWSLLFDLKILLMTPFRGIVNRQEPL